MSEKEIRDKIGAMHLRFQDDMENYQKLLDIMEEYSQRDFEQYGRNILKALREGLENFERYLKIENELSPRAVVIKKRELETGEALSRKDPRGNYCVTLIMDDESKREVVPKRKDSHLLYILMLLCSQKNGLSANFFQHKRGETTPAIEIVIQLIKLIYPYMDDAKAKTLANGFASFTETFQHMKAPIRECLENAGMPDDEYWYIPYFIELGRQGKLYKMHIPQVNITYPTEFKPIIDALPDAADVLNLEGNDIKLSDMINDFAWFQKAAEMGDVDGLFYTGVYYATGDVVSQDYKKAIEYFTQADQKGNLNATFQIGVCYQFGFGVDEDIYKALEYFERAAAGGNADGAAWAAQIYERGRNDVEVNYQKAFNLYMIAAEQGNEEAIWYVIQGYLLGQGTEQNFEKAWEWGERAFGLGYSKVITLWGAYFLEKIEEEESEMDEEENEEENYDEEDDVWDDDIEEDWDEEEDEEDDEDIDEDWDEEENEEEEGLDEGDKEEIDFKEIAYALLRKGCDDNIPMAFLLRAKMLLKGYRKTTHPFDKAIYLIEKGADLGNEKCIDIIQKTRPDIYEEKKDIWVKRQRMNAILLLMTLPMGHMELESFIKLVDAYRERWQKSYLEIICMQLSIHKPHGEGGESGDSGISQRRITIRKAKDGKHAYELVLTLANGKEIVVNKINENSMMLYLLTIICSYKSGYTTKMAKDDICRPILKKFAKLAYANPARNIDDYVDDFMYYGDNKEKDYYKQYSRLAKQAIKEAVGTNDDVIYFLFENAKRTRQPNVRHMTLSKEFIEIPQELKDLADSMPDAYKILE